MFLGIEIFWAPLGAHFNTRLKGRAKMSRGRAQMEYLLANIIFMFFHGLFISCSYASDYVTLLNITWTRD